MGLRVVPAPAASHPRARPVPGPALRPSPKLGPRARPQVPRRPRLARGKRAAGRGPGRRPFLLRVSTRSPRALRGAPQLSVGARRPKVWGVEGVGTWPTRRFPPGCLAPRFPSGGWRLPLSASLPGPATPTPAAVAGSRGLFRAPRAGGAVFLRVSSRRGLGSPSASPSLQGETCLLREFLSS